jgi:hypothetical protein
MDDRLSKLKRKSVKSAQPSQEEKEAMMATLEKALLKDDRSVVQAVPFRTTSFRAAFGGFGHCRPSSQ